MSQITIGMELITMVRIVLIRHGYSEYNKLKKYSGQLDVPLDEIGERQADMTAKYVLENYRPDAIYSSDLSRAVRTVEPIANELGLEIEKRREFREIDVGLWHNMDFWEAKDKFPETSRMIKENPYAARYEGGESYRELMERMLRGIDEIREKCDGLTVAVASHNGAIKGLFRAMIQKGICDNFDTEFLPNASISVFDYDGKHADFIVIGYNGHLTETDSESRVV